MTATIYGNSGVFSLANTTAPQAVVPANGEPVDAVPPGATIQTVLDYVAKVGQVAYDTGIYGVSKIRWFSSVGDIKGLTGMATGDLAVLADPTYVGSGSQGLLSGFGLFMFVETVTWPQSLVDGVTDSWLVIQPDAGAGRWVNVSAGVGWNVGTNVSFQPKPAQRTKQWSNVGAINNTLDYVGVALTNIGTEITLGTGLPVNATIHLDFDFSARSPTAGTSGFEALIEVSVGGGAWTVVPGSKKPLGAGGGTGINTEWIPCHLGVAYVATTSDTFDFRVSLNGAAAQTMTIFRTWSARGTSYNATLAKAHMATSLLERLLASTSSRPRSNANAFISGDYTLQQGANVTLSQVGSVITIDASLAALTRVRAGAASFLTGDVTFAQGTGITLAQVGSTITINATAAGSLPSPYTATLVTYDTRAGSLQVTAPTVTAADGPHTIVKGVGAHQLVADEIYGGDVIIEGGDTDSTDGATAGNGVARGGSGILPGQGVCVGGLTTQEGGTAGSAIVQGRDGADHTTLTNVNGGETIVRGGHGKGTGSGGPLNLLGGDAPGAVAGLVRMKGGYGTAGGLVEIEGGDGDDGTDTNDGDVHLKGGAGNNVGKSIRMMASDGDAGNGGDLEMFAGFGSTATTHGGVSFGLGNAGLDFTTAERFARTYPRKNQTTNATPTTVFSDAPSDHQLITIVSVSQARTTSAGDGGLVVRRSTWRSNGGVAQVGTTKNLTEADEEAGFNVTHTYGSTVDVKAVGKAATTVEWRHTIQVFYHSVGS